MNRRNGRWLSWLWTETDVFYPLRDEIQSEGENGGNKVFKTFNLSVFCFFPPSHLDYTVLHANTSAVISGPFFPRCLLPAAEKSFRFTLAAPAGSVPTDPFLVPPSLQPSCLCRRLQCAKASRPLVSQKVWAPSQCSPIDSRTHEHNGAIKY